MLFLGAGWPDAPEQGECVRIGTSLKSRDFTASCHETPTRPTLVLCRMVGNPCGLYSIWLARTCLAAHFDAICCGNASDLYLPSGAEMADESSHQCQSGGD